MPTSPTSGPGGGSSYTPPTARGTYYGNAVSVTNGAIAALTWNTLDIGTDLFDRTDPANPAILTAGIYGISVEAIGLFMTLGGYIQLELALDEGGIAQTSLFDWSPTSNAIDDSPHVSIAACSYLQAGAIVQVGGSNRDGAATRDLVIAHAIVQRIT